jgi:hypothetical protein
VPVTGDCRVLTDRAHELRNPGPKARAEFSVADICLFKDVMKNAGGDHVIGSTGAIKQPPHLERVLDIWAPSLLRR